MLGLAGNAPGPVLTGSQDFRAGRPCRLSPIQLTVETTIVVEDGYEQRRLDKKAETRSTMDACPRWKDAPSGLESSLRCLKGRITALQCNWLRRIMISVGARMKIRGAPTLATGRRRRDGARSFVGSASELVADPSTCFDPSGGDQYLSIAEQALDGWDQGPGFFRGAVAGYDFALPVDQEFGEVPADGSGANECEDSRLLLFQESI